MISLPIALAGAICSCLIYVLAAAVYNLYLHPLNGLPGPKLWIVFPVLRQIYGIRGTYDMHMREFHEKYGHVVRYSLDLFFIKDPRIALTAAFKI
jgi:hypothetical protein